MKPEERIKLIIEHSEKMIKYPKGSPGYSATDAMNLEFNIEKYKEEKAKEENANNYLPIITEMVIIENIQLKDAITEVLEVLSPPGVPNLDWVNNRLKSVSELLMVPTQDEDGKIKINGVDSISKDVINTWGRNNITTHVLIQQIRELTPEVTEPVASSLGLYIDLLNKVSAKK